MLSPLPYLSAVCSLRETQRLFEQFGVGIFLRVKVRNRVCAPLNLVDLKHLGVGQN